MRAKLFLMVSVLSLLVSTAFANIYPPTPTKNFLGDANGNTYITGVDVLNHQKFLMGRPFSYDTLQPQTPSQLWNTCDMDGDRGCTGQDIILLNNYLLSRPVSTGARPWVLANENLPLTANQDSVWIPFNLNLYSTHATLGLSGRPGLSVVVEIDPSSPGTGSLSGRSCTPEAGTRDQAALPGAQCALAVTITDWNSAPGKGLTESGAYGLNVYSDGDGDLKLNARIEANPKLDIPATSISMTVSFTYAYTASIDCSNPGPNPVNEGQSIQCTVTGFAGTPIIDIGVDTCGGVINGTGPWTYDFTAPVEVYTQVCVAGVINGTATDQEFVMINEVNRNPYFISTAPTTATEGVAFSYNPTYADDDLADVAPTDPGYVGCQGITGNTCGSWLVFTGCDASGTPGEADAPAGCSYDINIIDGYSANAVQNVSLNLAEVNVAPINNAPTTASGNELTLITFDIAPTDPDIPVQTLTCEVVSNGCPGGALNSCVFEWTPTEAQGPNAGCNVVTRVHDGLAYSANITTTVTVNEANQEPVWTSPLHDITVPTNGYFSTYDGQANDADLPANTLTCSKISQTCSFPIIVSGSGSGAANCYIEFTANASPENCSVDIRVNDGAGGIITDSISISVQGVIYVDQNSWCWDCTGESWDHAFQTVQEGMDAAESGWQVWVAEGTYSTGTTTSVLVMKDDVTIYGGFVAWDSSLDDRDPANCLTVLDGAGVSYHVVTGATNAVIDGFTITGGYATGSAPNSYGGGLYNFIETGLLISNCIFDSNYSTNGGAIYSYSGSSVNINKCVFDSNTSTYGGAIYLYQGSPTVTNCVLINNHGNYGGAIYNLGSFSPIITNCTFSGNSALYGGAIYNSSGNTPTIKNSILWGDTASINGNEIYGGTATVTYSDVQGGWSGTGNIGADPLFIGGGDYRLQVDSPCISEATSVGAPVDDLEGNPRPLGVGFDMGSYEYSGDAPGCVIDLACSTSINEDASLSCPIRYNQVFCTGTLSLGAANTFAGASVVDNGGGFGTYSAPAQGETAGPGSRVAAIQLATGVVSDSDTVTINEVNQAPVNNAPATASGDELTLISFDIAPTDADLPPQTLTCSMVSNACPGGSLTGCTFNWTPTEAQGPNGGCAVVTRVYDGVNYSTNITTTVTVNEINQAPIISNLPATKAGSITKAYSYDVDATDLDVPADVLVFSLGTDTCSFTPTVNSSSGLVSWTCGQRPENCMVQVTITDDATPPPALSDTETLTIDCNANPTLAGTFYTPFTVTEDVYVSGNYAYVADQTMFNIIDISNPASPTLTGTYYTPGSANGVYISGHYAYVAVGESGLQIINISNPASPTLTGSYNTPGNAYDVYVSGHYAYVADYDYGLQIINIQNPASPYLRGTYNTLGSANDVYVSGLYAYVADGYEGLQIINISNPLSPTLTGTYNTPGYANGVYISGHYAYVADDDCGLQIIDVSNTASPTLAGAYDTPGYAMNVFVSGHYAYVTDDESGLQMINISNPVSPTLAGSYDTPGYARGVYVSGNYAYVADYADSGLQIIQVTYPVNPTLAGSYDTPDQARDVYVSGNYAYVADGTAGLQIIDASDPALPTLSGSYDPYSGNYYGVFVSGNNVYMTEVYWGLEIYEVSNPALPAYWGGYNTPDFAMSAYVSGHYAYVADYDSGLLEISISNPGSPTLSGTYNTPGPALYVYVSGNYAYVADGASGLQIIDISYLLTLTGTYDTPGSTYGVYVSGLYAYLADGDAGFHIIDISNPASPTLKGTYNTPYGAGNVYVSGQYAYVTDGSALLKFNVSNPATPTLVWTYNAGYPIAGVYVDGSYAYLANLDNGLKIIRIAYP